MARCCVLENTLTQLAIEHALGNLGVLTYFAIVSPLEKTENMFNSLNISPLRKILFQINYQQNLLDNSNVDY